MADKDYNVSVKLLTGNFKSGLKSAESDIKHFTDSSSASFNKMNVAAEKAAKFVKGFMVGAVILEGGKKLFELAKGVAEFDEKLVRMKVDAGLTGQQTFELKNQIMDLGNKTGITDDSIADLSKSALKSSKSFSFVKDNLGFMTVAMQASGASAETIGEAFGEIHEKTGMASKDFQTLVGNLYSFGKQSGHESTLKDMLPNMGKLISTFKAANPKASFKQIQDYLMQSMFVANPEALQTAMKRMNTSGALKYMRKLGLDIRKELSISEVVDKVKSTFKTRAAQLAALNEIFGRGSIGLAKLLDQQEEYNKSVKAVDAKQIFADATTESETFTASMNRLNNIVMSLSDSALSPAIGEITKALSSMDPETIKSMTEAFTSLGKAIGFTAKWTMMFIAAMNELLTNHMIDKAKEDTAKGMQRIEIQKLRSEANAAKESGHMDSYYSIMGSADVQERELDHPTKSAKSLVAESVKYTAGPNGIMPQGNTESPVFNLHIDNAMSVDGSNIPVKSKTTLKTGKQHSQVVK